MTPLIQKLTSARFIPVIVVETVEEGIALAKTLVEANLPVAEVTFRSEHAPHILRAMKAHYPDLLVGAGTVLNQAQVTLAKDANADFIVSPGLNVNTIKASQDAGIPIIPGINNPTAIEMALNEGLTHLKFFPAEASGGTKMIQSLLAPYQGIELMPTGGINQNNVRDYLAIEGVFCCGLSWMVDSTLIKNQQWNEIKSRIDYLNNL